MKRLLLYCLILLGQSIILNAQIDNGIYHIKEENGDVRTSLKVIDGQYNLVVHIYEEDGCGELSISSGAIFESDGLIHFYDFNGNIQMEMKQEGEGLRVIVGFLHLQGRLFTFSDSLPSSYHIQSDVLMIAADTQQVHTNINNDKDKLEYSADSLRMGWYAEYYHMPGMHLRIRSNRTYTLSVDTCMISEGTWLSGFDDLFLLDSNGCIYYHLKIRNEELVSCSNNTKIPRLYLIQEFTRPPKLPKLWPDH